MRLPWTTGTRSFDEDLGLDVLDIARENPYTENDLKHNLELRGAVYAIIESLPRKVRKHIAYQHKVDIASVIILQRAAATEAAYKALSGGMEYQEEVSEYTIPDVTYPRGTEEA